MFRPSVLRRVVALLGAAVVVPSAVVVGAAAYAPAVGSAPAVSRWGAPALVDPVRGGLTTVSCAGASICRAGDRANLLYAWNGHTWSDGTRFSSSTTGIYAMSCATATFCAAVQHLADGTYRPIVHTTTGWQVTAPVRRGGAAQSVSCATATFCLLVDSSGNWQRWNGTVWSAPRPVGSGAVHLEVSCAAPGGCTAVDATGKVFVYVPHEGSPHWSVGIPHDPGATVTSIDCPTTVFCVFVDRQGRAVRHTSDGFTAPQKIDSTGHPLVAVDCASTTYCLAVDDWGHVITWDGHAWGALRTVYHQQAFTDVSCPAAAECMLTSEVGIVVRLHAGRWTQTMVAQASGAPTSIACPSSSRCVVVDRSGAGQFLTNSTWGAPFRNARAVLALADVTCVNSRYCIAVLPIGYTEFVDGPGVRGGRESVAPGTPLTAVSCAAIADCVAVGVDGTAARYNGFRWTPEDVGNKSLTDVSCVEGRCLAVAADGTVLTRTGQHWSAPARVLGADVVAVSCTSATFCMAITDDNRALRYNATSWQVTGTRVPKTRISCSGPELCAAVGGHSAALWTGTAWTTPQTVVHSARGTLVGVGCTPTGSRCVAVDDVGQAVQVSR